MTERRNEYADDWHVPQLDIRGCPSKDREVCTTAEYVQHVQEFVDNSPDGFVLASAGTAITLSAPSVVHSD
jgi:hypothetical protein